MPVIPTLLNVYSQLSKIPNIEIEPFDIISTVESYRDFWKPDQVKVILLAESYVFTSQLDYSKSINQSLIANLNMNNYPNNFVRFVYCLGYGENDCLNRMVANNTGTPQFWKIFYSCLHEIHSNQDFSPILKNKTNFSMRIENKIRLLEELKAKGIWLIDTSLMALYGKENKVSESQKKKIISTCWDCYIKKQIMENQPQKLICIGQGVASILKKELNLLPNFTVIPQPQAHLSSQNHIENFQMYYKICKSI